MLQRYDLMKNALIASLRNKDTSQMEFRAACEKLAYLLAIEAAELMDQKSSLIQTPLAETTGTSIKDSVVLVPILRSGLALMPAFMKFYPLATVGIIGMRRDEVTAIAENYYCKLPKIGEQDNIVILEPMLATGGSLSIAIELLLEKNIAEEKIVVVNVIAAPEGYHYLNKKFPKVKFLIAQMDQHLNEKKFIVPGLGDFGDRYFGTL